MTFCHNTNQDIWQCQCGVCAPFRRMITARRERRAKIAARKKSTVIPGETDRRLKDALTALPPSDRE